MDKTELWHKLRADPDFQPEWFRTMGRMPPTDKPITQWADGHADTRVHVIESMSYAENYVLCRCGVSVTLDMWDLHRGLVTAHEGSFGHSGAATDDEVSAFLSGVANPDTVYTPDEGFMQGGVPPANEAMEHIDCRHGEYCLIAYRVLNHIINMSDDEFDALYPQEVAA